MDCTTCTKFAGVLIDRRVLCRLLGPKNTLTCCKQYTRQMYQITENGNFCHTCFFFNAVQGPEIQPYTKPFRSEGTCSRYRLDLFDGSSRKSCQKYKQIL